MFELIEVRVLGEHAGRERFLHNELLSWLSIYGSAATPGVRSLGQKRVHQNRLLKLQTFRGTQSFPRTRRRPECANSHLITSPDRTRKFLSVIRGYRLAHSAIEEMC